MVCIRVKLGLDKQISYPNHKPINYVIILNSNDNKKNIIFLQDIHLFEAVGGAGFLELVQHTMHCTQHTMHCTQHTMHCTQQTMHCTQHTMHCTQHTMHCTQQTMHCTQHTMHCTQQTYNVHILLFFMLFTKTIRIYCSLFVFCFYYKIIGFFYLWAYPSLAHEYGLGLGLKRAGQAWAKH